MVVEKYLSKARGHLKTKRHLDHYNAIRTLLIQLVDEVRSEGEDSGEDNHVE